MVGGAFENWTSALGIDHQVAPGEAHERLLALVERRHAVLRRACEVYMSDRKLVDSHGVKEALNYVVPQQSECHSIRGWVHSESMGLFTNRKCLISWTPTSMLLS